MVTLFCFLLEHVCLVSLLFELPGVALSKECDLYDGI